MPEVASEDNISIKRKRLLYRSWHRGTREADLLLGRFADAHVPGFDEALLSQYETFLNNNDPDIFNWVSRQEPVPPEEDTPVIRLLLAFYPAK